MKPFASICDPSKLAGRPCAREKKGGTSIPPFMTSHELNNALWAFTAESDEERQLHDFLRPLQEVVLKLEGRLAAFANISSEGLLSQEMHSEVRSDTARVLQLLKQHKVRVILSAIDQLRDKIAATTRILGSESLLSTLHSALAHFEAEYDQLITTHTLAQAQSCAFSARELERSWRQAREFASATAEVLAKGHTPALDEADLTLLLFRHLDVSSFIAKLAALAALYEELCGLFDVALSSHPLRIGKIESGSMWVKVFGEARVIGLMIRLIEEGVHFVHRNFTTEGKLAALPRKVEAVEEALGLRAKLQAAGLGSPELDARIEKSSVLIGQQLTTLLGDEPRVTINRTEFSVGAEMLATVERLGHVPLLVADVEAAADDDLPTLLPPLRENH